MMQISLREFVRTGRFGPVALGQSRGELRAQLGEPDDMSTTTQTRGLPRLWKYGDFEFHFLEHTDALAMIFIDRFDIPAGGKSVSVDPWIIRRSLPSSVLVKALLGLGLDKEIVHDERRARIVVHASSGIQFAYYPSNLKRPVLDTLESVQISNWAAAR